MGLIILAVFIGVPIVEIAVFIEVGGWLGLWPTIAVVVGTAMAGTAMLRHQGLSVLARAQQSLARQELPVAEIVDGVCLLLAGALLLTPGFVTDALGFVLMVPGLRHALIWPMMRRLAARGGIRGGFYASPGQKGGEQGGQQSGQHGGQQGHGGGAGVIDGEYEEVRPQDEAPGDTRRLPGESDGDKPGGGGEKR